MFCFQQMIIGQLDITCRETVVLRGVRVKQKFGYVKQVNKG